MAFEETLNSLEIDKGYTYDRAGCLVYRDDDVLVIITDDGYELPKGHLADGENATEAAIRETEEETGISCQINGEPIRTMRHDNSTIIFYPAIPLRGEEKPTPKAEHGIYASAWKPATSILDDMSRRNFWQEPILACWCERL